MAGQGKPKTGGRAPGTPNKATGQVRQMIAAVADGLAPSVSQWLQKTADGERDSSDPEKWLIKPDPGYAASLYFQMIEYHIPKLARTESHMSVEEKSHEDWLNGLE